MRKPKTPTPAAQPHDRLLHATVDVIKLAVDKVPSLACTRALNVWLSEFRKAGHTMDVFREAPKLTMDEVDEYKFKALEEIAQQRALLDRERAKHTARRARVQWLMEQATTGVMDAMGDAT